MSSISMPESVTTYRNEPTNAPSPDRNSAVRDVRPRHKPNADGMSLDPTARTRGRPGWLKWTLHLVRRAHLYAGLLFVPWVFLFGATAFLFNHPSWFSNQLYVNFGADALVGTPLQDLPTPQQLAENLIAQVNAAQGSDYVPNGPAATLGRGGLSASLALADGSLSQLSIHANGQGGIIRPARGGRAAAVSGQPGAGRPGRGDPNSPGRQEPGNSEARKASRSGGRDLPDEHRKQESRAGGANTQRSHETSPDGSTSFAVADDGKLSSTPIDRLREALPALLSRLGLADAQILSVQMSPLTFEMRDAAQTWEMVYSADSGALSGTVKRAEAATASSLPLRNFLTNLHKTHGYPAGETNARTLWAVLVDVMAGVMIMWGATGLVMWWQIKRTRLAGGVCLVLGFSAASWLVLSMHALQQAS